MLDPLNHRAIAPRAEKHDCAERHASVVERLDRIEAALQRVETRLFQLPAPTAANEPAFVSGARESEWLTAKQVAQLFGISVKALYSDVERGGRFADAASRVGKRLRFSRRGLDRLPLRKPERRSHLQERVPSPGGSERW